MPRIPGVCDVAPAGYPYVMQYNLRYCLSCEADQDWDERGPCTKCQSERVTAVTYDPGPIGFAGDGVYIEHGTARLWQEQWYRTIQRFNRLRAVYRPGTYQGVDETTAIVEDFFEHCLRLEEWLAKDPGVDKGDKDKVLASVKGNEWLRVGKGVANCAKHRERDWDNAIDAVVRRVYPKDDRSAVAIIEWWRHGQEGGRHEMDALKLAEKCMAAWKTYLHDQKLRLWHAKTRRNYL